MIHTFQISSVHFGITQQVQKLSFSGHHVSIYPWMSWYINVNIFFYLILLFSSRFCCCAAWIVFKWVRKKLHFFFLYFQGQLSDCVTLIFTIDTHLLKPWPLNKFPSLVMQIFILNLNSIFRGLYWPVWRIFHDQLTNCQLDNQHHLQQPVLFGHDTH